LTHIEPESKPRTVRLLSERVAVAANGGETTPTTSSLPAVEMPPSIPPTEAKPSTPSRPEFLAQMTAVLMGIAAVAAARVLLLLALTGSFFLTWQAMTQSTLMSLAAMTSFNVLVVLPLCWLAYQKG
jgi:hypothetical protein